VPNHSLDVSIEDIVSPTKDPNFFRENPACANPIIKIKNVGTNTVTSIIFNYGLAAGSAQSYTWTGSLSYLDTSLVTFPPSTTMLTATVASNFSVGIQSVNGMNDQNSFNNKYYSIFTPVVSYPDTIIVKFFTNKSTDLQTGFNESSWALLDANGTAAASRNSCLNSKLYIDTVVLAPGCYKFIIDDSGCDGLGWWANTAAGNGSCRFEKMNAGGAAFYTYPIDIGCGYSKYFTVQAPANTNLVHLENIQLKNTVEVYPNPTSNQLFIKFDLTKSQKINYSLSDIAGKIILENTIDKMMGGFKTIDTKEIENGVYFLTTVLEDKTSTTSKIIIQH
jgi:hypothetical protein